MVVSGVVQIGNLGGDGFGSVQQYFLEMVNVDVVIEIVDFIFVQCVYEMNFKVIQVVDQMYLIILNICQIGGWVSL